MSAKLSPEAFAGLVSLFDRALHVAVGGSAIDRTCLACVHFNEATEVCGKWGERPPARTIVEGCEDFKRDDIPF